MHAPLKKMIAPGYVRQKRDGSDRRVKRLSLGPQGAKLEHELTEVQRRRCERIFQQVGPVAEKHRCRVMNLLSEQIEIRRLALFLQARLPPSSTNG